MAREGMLDEYVRRIDVLLRARFPHLATRIFETEPRRYAIQFDAALQDAAEIAEEFDRKILYATVNAVLTNDVPEGSARELATIADQDVTRNLSGLPFTRFDLFNLLSARFPATKTFDVRNAPDGAMEALVAPGTTDGERAAMKRFLDGLGMPSRWRVSHAIGPAQAPTYPYEHRLQILATRLTALGGFAAEDERRFFDTIDAAPTGSLRRADIIGGDPGVSRCLLDCSVGRHLNLRQVLLLYDEVWCIPPLVENMPAFLADQALGVNDLVSAADAGRLRFVLTYEERSSDLRLLEEAAERRPAAVLGRRMAGALLLADAARSAADYRFADPALLPGLVELCAAVSPALDMDRNDLVQTLLWPQSAVRGSVQPVVDRGTKGGPATMLAERIAERVRIAHGVDVRLDAYFAAERTHLAHALGATLIPALDESLGTTLLSRAVGQDLNFYAAFNTRVAPAWIGNRDRRSRGDLLAEPLPVFSFDSDVPMSELLGDSGLASTRRKGRALMSRLADLPGAMRADEIRRLKAELRARGRRETTRLLSFDSADTAVAIASVFANFVYPPVAGLAGAGRRLAELARRSPAIDRMLDALSADATALRGGNEDLDFLSRVDRVASLSRPP